MSETEQERPATSGDAPTPDAAGGGGDADAGGGAAGSGNRRRGSRGGRGRKPGGAAGDDRAVDGSSSGSTSAEPDELPDRLTRNTIQDPAVAEQALVRKPRIGDTRPAPVAASGEGSGDAGGRAGGSGTDGDPQRQRSGSSRRRRGGRGRGKAKSGGGGGGGGASSPDVQPVQAIVPTEAVELDEAELELRRGRERKGKPVGRYLMVVSVRDQATQIAVLEGRNLVEHYVSRPADDVFQIHGNIYLGKVQNVLPGMEAAFVDIATPKNAVLYRGDVQYDREDIEEPGEPKIEQILKPRQTVLCQVTKNPIAHKGARLTQEVSLPGRFVVLIPNSKTYGISKRLPDNERKRLRQVLDRVKPAEHGVIVRTAAEDVTDIEIERDVRQLLEQWRQIEHLAKTVKAPALLYREPDMAVRVIREEFNRDYRGVIIDDRALFEEVHAYVSAITPALADRVQHYDTAAEALPIFERHHVHEQLHRALDRKVWLPSGGSLIIEHTEALTVIDVNTGKNVGKSSLEETVYRNNLEAAEEIAKQLRLRDIGGIIVCDFIDMEIAENRKAVIKAFRDALARDKTRTQVFDISALGLVEMTRKRIGEGLLESLSSTCPECEGRGVVLDTALLGEA
ncbi:MAG: Rne/Rng family ribonuclease [Acidimicrobiales bacterium]|nr:Rne/Rng family ribonuclease [Acidimicrobiales bacterium]